LIQAGIKEVYFEEAYDSKNKKFDRFWRGIMEAQESITVFKQISVSPESLNMVIEVLKGSSARQMVATGPEEAGELDISSLQKAIGSVMGEDE
jgi:hypothetical protein